MIKIRRQPDILDNNPTLLGSNVQNDDLQEEWGVCAVIGEDCLTLAVGMGPEVFAVARLKTPIPPREWEQILSEEWENPEDGAIARAVERAGAIYGIAHRIPCLPVVGNFQILGEAASE